MSGITGGYIRVTGIQKNILQLGWVTVRHELGFLR